MFSGLKYKPVRASWENYIQVYTWFISYALPLTSILLLIFGSRRVSDRSCLIPEFNDGN